jgi:hypothetical protein
MLLGAAVFTTVFPMDESGAKNVRLIVPGVTLGIGAAYIFRNWLHPAPLNVQESLVGIVPFMLLRGIGLSMRLLRASAVEYNNFFLVLSQPSHLAPVGLPIASQGLALLIGTCLAVGVLHFVLPVDAKQRQRLEARAVFRHLEKLARRRNNLSVRRMEGSNVYSAVEVDPAGTIA